MSFTSEYNKLRRKRKDETEEKANTGNSFEDVYMHLRSERSPWLPTDYGFTEKTTVDSDFSEKKAPDRRGILSGGSKKVANKNISRDEERTWFSKGAFEDGYDFGDVTKTILGTIGDVGSNVVAGVAEMPEKIFDAGVTLATDKLDNIYDKVKKGHSFVNRITGKDADENTAIWDAAKAVGKGVAGEIIKKDLYDADEFISETLFHGVLDENSVFGEKIDSLGQSAGQLAATAGLQAVGIPWWLTTGATSFGGEMENALNQGATFEEAKASSLITAGAEILTEKISGGISFGGKTLDSVLTKQLARGISNKVVRTFFKFGLDAAGEGFEELLSGTLSAIGQKLTYADDKEISELFSSEDAFESFIGGMLLGGGSSAINIVKSNKQGIDPVTELTDNEQKVFDKVYKDSIAEAEKDGKKLTNREKSKLYDALLDDFEKGYISTDIIEEIFGGEDYTSYRDAVTRQESMQNEYNELNTLKQGEMTGEQIDRRTELKEQLAEYKDNSILDNLKSKLSLNVFNIVKDSKLAESYNEKARRGQVYEADLSKYDAKQAEVIKRAVDSGILNNTNRTHEFVDMIAKISADKGVLFDFTNNEKLKNSGFAVDGKTVNGYVTKDGVTLNIDSSKSLNSVVGHEITHVLEGTEFYDVLKQTVTDYAKAKGDYQGRYDNISKLYEGIEDADIDAELTSDLVGDYLFTDSEFIRKLSVNKRNLFQKLYDEIKYLYKVATAGSKEARELEKVKKAFEDAYRAEGKGVSGTKHSLSDSEGTQLTKEQQEYFRDSKVRDAEGRLIPVYHGTETGGFTVFDPQYSDDGISLFFTDDIYLANSYSDSMDRVKLPHSRKEGFSRNIEPQHKGKRNNKGVYKSYLNLTNPYVIDGKGKEWNKIDEFNKEFNTRTNNITFSYDKNTFTLTANAVVDGKTISRTFDLSEAQNTDTYSTPIAEGTHKEAVMLNNQARAIREYAQPMIESFYKELGLEKASKDGNRRVQMLISDVVAHPENFAENQAEGTYNHDVTINADTGEVMGDLTTRKVAKWAKDKGYDGVIFKNIIDVGGYGGVNAGEPRNVYIAFNSEQVKDIDNKNPTASPDIRYSLSDSDGKPIDMARISDNETDTRYSLSYNAEIAQGQRDYLANHKMSISTEELEEAQKVTQAMVDVMMKYSSILPEDKIGKVLTKNGSYDRSVENTTICVRTLAYNEFVDKVQEEIGRPLTQMESFLVSQKLYDIASDPQCLYCYVSLDRKAFNDMLLRYMQDRDSVITKYNNSDKTQEAVEALYQEFLHGRKDTTQMRSRFDKWIGYVDNGTQLLSLADIATEARQSEIANGKNGVLSEQLKDARAYAQSASWSKIQKNYVAYRDEILKLGDKVVKNLNEHYGLRWYSFSDYSPAFIVENMQQITDASIRGLKGLSYTKDTDFAEIFAPSGMNVNISVFVNQDANGNFFIDEKQSANLEKALDLRRRYPNVGIVATVTNDEALRWAGEQEWTDVIIPFHIIRTGTDVAEYYKWLNYTAESADSVNNSDLWNAYLDSLNLSSENARKKVSKNIYPSEHNNDKATYLNLCESRGLSPRFARFAGEDWYMKLVNETRLSASESSPLKPSYNLEAAQESFQRFVEKGGYEGGWYKKTINVDAEAKAVAQDVLAGKKANEVPYGRQDGFTPESLIAGRKINRNHGQHSLSWENEAPIKRGNYNVYGKDIALETAQEEIAPIQEQTTAKTDVTETPENMFPDSLTPTEELDSLLQRRNALDRRMLEMDESDQFDEAEWEQIHNEYLPLHARITELESEISKTETGRLNSLDDTDAPIEMDAPYYSENQSVTPEDPFEDRDFDDVGNRKVKAYMYENPEVKPFFQEEARGMLYDLHGSTKGERIYIPEGLPGSYGAESYGHFDGVKRHTTDDIAYLLDSMGYTYAQIEKGLNAIIEDNGAENNAISKRIEFMLNDRLMKGYRDIDGMDNPANQDYINLLKEKQITEYSEEAFNNFMQNAERYAPMDDDIAPVVETNVETKSSGRPMQGNYFIDQAISDMKKTTPIAEENALLYEARQRKGVAEGQQAMFEEPETPKKLTRSELHSNIMDGIKNTFKAKGFDFDNVLKNAKNLSTLSTVDNTPQRVMEKALGYKEGQILADETINKVAQNETEGIKWLNSFTDKKNGLLAQISKQYNIKPGSKASAAAQMYAEGFYVAENNDIIQYGDAELAKDFPDAKVQANIKGLANDPRIRQIYDETLAMINESRARNAYPEIPRLDNYFLHFRAMEDTFSKLGLPFNPNDIKAKDLPTDLNGVTADLKPGQPYFASAMHRTGKRTSFDLLGGLEKYLSSAKNQIYHIDDIQTLRALRNYIADTYGQGNGLEGLDALSEEEQQERIQQVYGAHLSTFAKFLNEEANVIAGKTALIDRGIEGILGRRAFTFLDTINKQVGSNMVGFNVSSSMTNFLAGVQAIAKTNKLACVKALAQTASSKIQSIFGKTDSFVENNPTIIRRKGAERFYRTPYQKFGDAGYVLMSAVDNITTEFIVRAKYNEFIQKGMSEQQANIEADKWTSRLMADRSLGQMPQLYNSKALGLITKFQLEVRNQLDSQFYDTIQETKASNEDIENGLARNAKTAAKVTATFFELAVLQHLFGKAFESVAGYNPAFDIISVLATALGFDDDEESEDTALDNIQQGFLELAEDLPYTSVFTGGRIPLSSALPDVKTLLTGKDEYGSDVPLGESLWKNLKEIAPYYFLPTGYGQIKKTTQGLSMFNTNEDHPIAGSYTDSGKLRFPVDDTPGNRVKAGLFGQYSSENARDYFDNERAPLTPEQTEEFIDVDLPIADYWEYREGLKGLKTLEEKAEYINDLDLEDWQKNLLINNIADRKEDIDMSNYDDYGSFDEFDYASKNPEKYAFFKENGISYEDYANADEDAKSAYTWAFNNPEGFTLSKAVANDVVEYRKYTGELYDIKADKDSSGKSISGSRKEKVIDYVNNLDIDYGARLILFKSEYNADDTYNQEIIDYLNERDDISYDDMVTILKELGFEVTKDGSIYW